MKLNKHFKQFHHQIGLKKNRLKRITSAMSNLETFSDSDGPISEVKIDLFPQGSVAINTAVIPIKQGDEFDADAVIVLDISKWPRERQDPLNVIRWFANRLRNNHNFRDKVREKNRCVRINYAGDFHLDVVPALRDNAGYVLIPTKEEGTPWKFTNPKGYIEWVKSINAKSGGKFCRIVKMLKHWRNLKMGRDTAPKSIILTTLVGLCFETGDVVGSTSDAETLVDVMEALNRNLKNCLSKPQICNPSLESEDLSENWDEAHFALFKKRFDWATRKARQAYDEVEQKKSIEFWQELFGDSYFQKTLSGGAKMAEAVGVGDVFVKSSGEITLGKPEGERSATVPKHRSYGS